MDAASSRASRRRLAREWVGKGTHATLLHGRAAQRRLEARGGERGRERERGKERVRERGKERERVRVRVTERERERERESGRGRDLHKGNTC